MLRIADFEDNEAVFRVGVNRSVDTPPDTQLIGVGVAGVRTFNDVGISNEVFLFGYPVSIGLPGQLEPDKPLISKGIVAGLNNANRTIILDAPVFQGNSGGLAIESEFLGHQIRFRAIGVVTQIVPFFEQMVSRQFGTTNTNVENSGYSIVEPIDKVLELLW